MKHAPIFFLAITLFAGVARADPVLLDAWNTDALVQTLRALGATDIRLSRAGVEPSIIARTADGLSVGLYGRECSATTEGHFDCRSLEGLISYEITRRPDRIAEVERLNRRFDAGKFTLESGGTVRLTRYIGLEGGVTNANLTSQLRAFFSLGALAAQTLWARTPAVAPPASATATKGAGYP